MPWLPWLRPQTEQIYTVRRREGRQLDCTKNGEVYTLACAPKSPEGEAVFDQVTFVWASNPGAVAVAIRTKYDGWEYWADVL